MSRIVDRMLPKMDGLTLVGALRNQKNETPVMILWLSRTGR